MESGTFQIGHFLAAGGLIFASLLKSKFGWAPENKFSNKINSKTKQL